MLRSLIFSLIFTVATVVSHAQVVTNIAYLRTLMDPVNYAPTDTTTLFTVDGIVTTHTNITGSANAHFYIQDATAGVAVFVGGGSSIRPKAGDLVRVTGPLGAFNSSLFELNLVSANASHSVITLSSSNALPAPRLFEFSQTNNPTLMEQSIEGSYLVVSNVYLDRTATNFTSNSNVILTNQAGELFTLRIDSRVGDINGKPKPSGLVNIYGVMGQFDTNAPFTSGYQLFATRYADIVRVSEEPTISPIANQQTGVGIAVGPIAFTVADTQTAASTLTLAGRSSNTALVPETNITFGGSDENRNITITPAAGQQGLASISVIVTDPSGNSATNTFQLIVGAPAISDIPDLLTSVNRPVGPVSFTISDAESDPASLTLSATSSNPGLIPEASVVFGGSGSNRTVTLTPATDQAGTAAITVSVSDGSSSSSNTFFITVARTNLGLLASDDFNRPDGPLVDGSGAWLYHSGTILGQLQIVNQQVQLIQTNSEDVNKELLGFPISTNDGSVVYSSFTVNFSQLPSRSGTYFAHLKDDNIAFRARVFASTTNAAPGFFRIGIANSSDGTALSGQIPIDLTTNVTYTIVTRYNVGTGVSTIWLNPVSENSGGVTAVDSTTPILITAVAFRQSSGIGTIAIDDLKVGGTFADVVEVTAVPVPLAISKTANGIEISWSASVGLVVLQRTTQLVPPDWQPVGETAQPAGDQMVVTINNPTDQGFFRLVR